MDSAAPLRVDEHISRLHSERFGVLVAKLNRVDSTTSELLDAFAAREVKLVIARIAAEDVRGIALLESRGFRTMDCQVLHRFDFGSRPIPDALSADYVREMEAGETAAAVAVARESFDGYGHYAADERLEKARCREAYVDWARRMCEEAGVADKIFVADMGGGVSGFLGFKLRLAGNGHCAAGVMGAVASSSRGKGVFKALIARGLQWGASIGLRWEEHATLVTNYPVNRAFADAGSGSPNRASRSTPGSTNERAAGFSSRHLVPYRGDPGFW